MRCTKRECEAGRVASHGAQEAGHGVSRPSRHNRQRRGQLGRRQSSTRLSHHGMAVPGGARARHADMSLGCVAVLECRLVCCFTSKSYICVSFPPFPCRVDHVEPWMSGNARGVSTAFNLIFRLGQVLQGSGPGAARGGGQGGGGVLQGSGPGALLPGPCAVGGFRALPRGSTRSARVLPAEQPALPCRADTWHAPSHPAC